MCNSTQSVRNYESPEFKKLKTFTTAIFDRMQIERHPIFDLLGGSKFSVDQKQEAALQLYHVVKAFPRFLSAIVTNLEDVRMRMPIVENILEEHGGLDLNKTHILSYFEFLKANGIAEERILNHKPLACVVAYNRAIIDLCLHYSPLEGLTALGTIEEIVARVSPVINQMAGLQKSTAENAPPAFFEDHQTLDVTHANDLYSIVAPSYSNEADREKIQRGAELGTYYHSRLYDDVYRAITG